MRVEIDRFSVALTDGALSRAVSDARIAVKAAIAAGRVVEVSAESTRSGMGVFHHLVFWAVVPDPVKVEGPSRRREDDDDEDCEDEEAKPAPVEEAKWCGVGLKLVNATGEPIIRCVSPANHGTSALTRAHTARLGELLFSWTSKDRDAICSSKDGRGPYCTLSMDHAGEHSAPLFGKNFPLR